MHCLAVRPCQYLIDRPAPPLGLRSWRGFGNGCSLEQHVNYGACLDGRCCARHSIETRNALRVVQFLGRAATPSGEADRRRQSRHRLRASSPTDKDTSAVAGEDLSLPRGHSANSSSSRQAGTADSSGVPGSTGGASARVRRGSRRKTPLHFASERGELSLVDRWEGVTCVLQKMHRRVCFCALHTPGSLRTTRPFLAEFRLENTHVLVYHTYCKV